MFLSVFILNFFICGIACNFVILGISKVKQGFLIVLDYFVDGFFSVFGLVLVAEVSVSDVSLSFWYFQEDLMLQFAVLDRFLDGFFLYDYL